MKNQFLQFLLILFIVGCADQQQMEEETPSMEKVETGAWWKEGILY